MNFSEVAVCSTLVIMLTLWPGLCMAEGSGCGTHDENYLVEQRTKNIFENIRIELMGLKADTNETEPEYDGTDDGLEETLQRYNSLQNSSQTYETGIETASPWPYDSCRDNAFYAERVSSFDVTMNIDEQSDDKVKSKYSSDRKLLVSYTGQLDFHLNDSLKHVSRASLLLYQLPTLTGPNRFPRDYHQFIEISTVLGDESRIIEGKDIDTFNGGFVVFDIKPAVVLWIERGIEGPVVLMIKVFCDNSPNCASVDASGRGPAVVRFLTNTQDLDRIPRVIVNSFHPRESKARVAKRSTPEENNCTSRHICCVKQLIINFARDLNIPNIVHPPSFEANFCQGECPSISGTNKNNNTDRFTFLRELGNNHPASSIRPCCTGADYGDLPVIVRSYVPAVRKFTTDIIRLHQVKVISCRCA